VSKRSVQKQIRSLQLRIQEHEEKIRREQEKPVPDHGLIRHWGREIEALKQGLEKAKKRGGGAT
jgi:predicted  nucleic acid-binding Zn-ribbon protein